MSQGPAWALLAVLVAPEAWGQTCVATGPEVCESNALNQIDNDCDGSVNTNAGAYMQSLGQSGPWGYLYLRDGDHDGSGDPGVWAYLCAVWVEPPSSWAHHLMPADCDDADAAVNPDASEDCNDRDDNCDGAVDEPTPWLWPPVAGCDVYTMDEDQDGFASDDPLAQQICVCPSWVASPNSQSPSCSRPGAPAGAIAFENRCYSPNATDCSDRRTDIHPGVPIDAVNGQDDDCDGRILAIEVDCDNDGTSPLVPTATLIGLRDPTAARLGLTPCTEVAAVPALTCFGTSLQLSCNTDTALWEVDTQVLEALELFSNGSRIGQVGMGDYERLDCDDTCASRAPGLPEACDGVDNDCRRAVGTDLDADGIPDAMAPNLVGWGTVAAAEVSYNDEGSLVECGTLAAPQDQIALSVCEPLVDRVDPPRPYVESDEEIAGCTTSDAQTHCGCGTGGRPVSLGLLTLVLVPLLRRRAGRS